MAVLIDKFKSDFKLRPSGAKGWYIGPASTPLSCPVCHHTNGAKLAFIFSSERNSSFKCPKCGARMKLEKYLWLIKKQEYIKRFREYKQEDILKKKSLKKEKYKIEIKELEEVMLPLFFKRIKYSKYLQSRGAKLNIYKHWIIGKTDFEDSLKDYLIFVIPENGKNIGWVARSLKSKKEIDQINKNSKYKILRWRNSKSDFGQIIFGLDEITNNTKQIILVEGITSKMRVDCELELYNQEEIKCCCTFGKKITEIQLQKIRTKGTNIDEVILFYDSDAVRESKEIAYKLQAQFNQVNVAFCDLKNEEGDYKDAGDLNKDELLKILDKKESPFMFFENKMAKKSLK